MGGAEVTITLYTRDDGLLNVEIDSTLTDARDIMSILAHGVATTAKHGERQGYKESDLIKYSVERIEEAFTDPNTELV